MYCDTTYIAKNHMIMFYTWFPMHYCIGISVNAETETVQHGPARRAGTNANICVCVCISYIPVRVQYLSYYPSPMPSVYPFQCLTGKIR